MKSLFPLQKPAQLDPKSKVPAVIWRAVFLVAALGFGSAFSAKAAPATFDFDTSTPTLTTGQGVPFNQTSGGVTASFSAAGGAFSVQTDASTGFTLSQFSGKYFYPNVAESVLDIQFSQLLTNITFTFGTADFPPIEIPTPIVLIAYANSASTPPVGSVSARGTYGSDTLPMGALTFDSATPFNLVRINIQPGGGMGFLMDNVTVQSSGVDVYTITTSAAPGAGGSTSGDGAYTNGASVTVVATANAGYAFVNWTENGAPVSSSASYTFTASANRTLVANFAAALPTLQSSATVEGPYSDDLTAVIDGALQTITTTATLPMCFYRLRYTTNFQRFDRRSAGFHAVEEIADVGGSRIAPAGGFSRLQLIPGRFTEDFPTAVIDDEGAFGARERHAPRATVKAKADPDFVFPHQRVRREFIDGDLGVRRFRVVLEHVLAAARHHRPRFRADSRLAR